MTEREHDFLKEVILEQLRQLRRCGRAVQLDDEEDYVNDVFVELLSSPDLEEIRNRLVDLISKFANRVTNRNRHSIALPEEEYVQGTQLKTNRRKRVCEIREADMSAHRFNDMLDQHVSHHISVNCSTTTNSDNLVLNCPESEKKSRNFWTRKFRDLSDVTSALWPATGPAPAAGGAAGLVVDIAIGQRLLQFGNTRVGDLGAGREVELLQIDHPFKVYQPRVADLLVAAKESRCCGGQQRYRSVGNSRSRFDSVNRREYFPFSMQ